jgi:hypothetical protein
MKDVVEAYKKVIAGVEEDLSLRIAKLFSISIEEADAAVLELIVNNVEEADIKKISMMIDDADIYSIDEFKNACIGWATQWKDRTELKLDDIVSLATLTWLTNERKRNDWVFKAREFAFECGKVERSEIIAKAMIANVECLSIMDSGLNTLMMALIEEGKLIKETIKGLHDRMIYETELNVPVAISLISYGFSKMKFDIQNGRAAVETILDDRVVDKMLNAYHGFLVLNDALSKAGEALNKVGDKTENNKIAEVFEKTCEVARQYDNGEYARSMRTPI